MSIADPQSFLVNFGYLPEPSGDGHSVEAVADAIASVQRTYGLPETGEWDAQTDLRVSRAPRCGCSDVQLARDAMGFWGTKDLTYAIQRRPEVVKAADFDAAVDRAFRSWQGCCGLSFQRTDSPQANLILGVGRGQRAGFDGPMGTLAYAYLPPQPGYLGQLQMLYDQDEAWAVDGSPAGIDVEAVSCHEFGHLIGFDHDPSPGQLMYAIYDPRVRVPQSNDIARAVAVYGAARAPSPPPVVPQPPTAAGHKLRLMVELDGRQSGPYTLTLP